MTAFRAVAIAALLLLSATSSAFNPSSMMASARRRGEHSGRTKTVCRGSNSDEDPTKVWYAGVANVIQNALTNSPLNEGKKALVRALAGDYDQAATRAKLENMIATEKVLMFSFPT